MASEWTTRVVPYIGPFAGDHDANEAVIAVLQKLREEAEKENQANAEEEEEGEDLCNCEFSLAYGGRILLSNTALRLKRGRRYGLCGANGAGKVRGAAPKAMALLCHIAVRGRPVQHPHRPPCHDDC
jgi:elongation factor 3